MYTRNPNDPWFVLEGLSLKKGQKGSRYLLLFIDLPVMVQCAAVCQE